MLYVCLVGVLVSFASAKIDEASFTIDPNGAVQLQADDLVLGNASLKQIALSLALLEKNHELQVDAKDAIIEQQSRTLNATIRKLADLADELNATRTLVLSLSSELEQTRLSQRLISFETPLQMFKSNASPSVNQTLTRNITTSKWTESVPSNASALEVSLYVESGDVSNGESDHKATLISMDASGNTHYRHLFVRHDTIQAFAFSQTTARIPMPAAHGLSIAYTERTGVTFFVYLVGYYA
eukprot:TRINITY_DN7375_c0_g1_i2.p1 TRINITY_DN7375_c0_g1~~TRINITY_DN7375_c0_g1_i2.p1  ORF type:complete len:241 (+),score=32.11 TRINITY_DN7375_c0_g1_i2:106-828(+)